MLKEFKEFAMKGNMLDMAIGIIIGAAFGAIIKSLVADVLMPPMSPVELTIAFTAGGITRGLLVGLVTGLALWVFVDLEIHDPLAIIFYAIGASAMMSLLGLIGGIWALVLAIIAAKMGHGTDWWKAILAYFLPMILCCCLITWLLMTFGFIGAIAD